MTKVWSCGGGTQSAAIAALIYTERLEKPDFALIVDTGREKSSTWEYYDSVLRPAMASVGVDLVKVEKAKYATVDLFGTEGKADSLLLPVFADNGKFSTYCSDKWKRQVAMRWLREQGVEKCENWMGISCDELRRVRVSREKWLTHRYPLIEQRMFRDDCRALVERVGWPVPPRSSCWMCPNMGDREWLEIKDLYPADFARAVELEEGIRALDPGFFLHRERKPINQVEFKNSEQNTLFCDSGYCFV